MRVRTKRTRNFIIVLALFLLATCLVLPRGLRRLIQPAASAAGKTFIVDTTSDSADANAGDGVCQTAAGKSSLRAAIEESNAKSGTYTINFNIAGTGLKTITPNSPLPNINYSVTIDGYSQAGASPNTLVNGDNAVLLIELNGTNAGSTAGFNLYGSPITVKGLVINRFAGSGIFSASHDNTFQGNFIGTNASGTAALGNTGNGIDLNGSFAISTNNLFGGTTPAARNVISGNGGFGLWIYSLNPGNGANNLVQGNFIGTNAAGTAALGNIQGGVLVQTNGNTVGATGAVWQIRRAHAMPTAVEDQAHFGMVGITRGQTMRLNIVNLNAPPDADKQLPPDPCRVVLSFRDAAGHPFRNSDGQVIRREVSLQSGQSDFLDLNGDMFGGPSTNADTSMRVQLRPFVRVLTAPPEPDRGGLPPDPCRATMEVFDNASGRTSIFSASFTAPPDPERQQ